MQDRSMIFGEPFSGEITPLSQLTSESGNVIVEGKVFDVDHRHMNKANTWVLRFDVTDYAGSICVTSFMTEKAARPIINGIEKDMWLQIRGKVTVMKMILCCSPSPFDLFRNLHDWIMPSVSVWNYACTRK